MVWNHGGKVALVTVLRSLTVITPNRAQVEIDRSSHFQKLVHMSQTLVQKSHCPTECSSKQLQNTCLEVSSDPEDLD